jgi:hypothetical protein
MVASFFLPGAERGKSPSTTGAQAADKTLNTWIVNPAFDTLFVFGGALWLMFGLQIFCFHWDTFDPHAPGMAGQAGFLFLLLTTLGQHLFSDAHTACTYARIYATKENRERFKLYTYYLPWCSLALFVLCLLYPRAAGFCVYLHMMWVYQHYVGQSFGISLIYCYKRNYYFKNWERETYRLFMHSLSAYVISSILCYRDSSPSTFYGVTLPFYGLPPILAQTCRVAFIVMSIGFVAMVVRKYIVEKKLIPIPTLCMAATAVGIGLSNGMANSMIWVYGPPFFHGSQYLAISLGYYLKEKALKEGNMSKVTNDMMRSFISADAFKYWGLMIASGMVIYVMLPKILEPYGYGFVFTATVIQACINFHHFVTDGAIWRLRDKTCREILLA